MNITEYIGYEMQADCVCNGCRWLQYIDYKEGRVWECRVHSIPPSCTQKDESKRGVIPNA